MSVLCQNGHALCRFSKHPPEYKDSFIIKCEGCGAVLDEPALRAHPGLHCPKGCGYDICGTCAREKNGNIGMKFACLKQIVPNSTFNTYGNVSVAFAKLTNAARERVQNQQCPREEVVALKDCIGKLYATSADNNKWCESQLARMRDVLFISEGGFDRLNNEFIRPKLRDPCSVMFGQAATNMTVGTRKVVAVVDDACVGLKEPPLLWRKRLHDSERQCRSKFQIHRKSRSHNLTVLRMIERRASTDFFHDDLEIHYESESNAVDDALSDRARSSARSVLRLLREQSGPRNSVPVVGPVLSVAQTAVCTPQVQDATVSTSMRPETERTSPAHENASALAERPFSVAGCQDDADLSNQNIAASSSRQWGSGSVPRPTSAACCVRRLTKSPGGVSSTRTESPSMPHQATARAIDAEERLGSSSNNVSRCEPQTVSDVWTVSSLSPHRRPTSGRLLANEKLAEGGKEAGNTCGSEHTFGLSSASMARRRQGTTHPSTLPQSARGVCGQTRAKGEQAEGGPLVEPRMPLTARPASGCRKPVAMPRVSTPSRSCGFALIGNTIPGRAASAKRAR
eukprot:TRINITY_DN67736_c0_g1_i1.p1 TRINITY_DN67736_c0_g1~~TRINITY_DN67736_c0_g1_i1.p1  ORF type:complete len:569 (-),score=61.57 TRINITY_DN67736_c0_g1_i1:36-1742(-)